MNLFPSMQFTSAKLVANWVGNTILGGALFQLPNQRMILNCSKRTKGLCKFLRSHCDSETLAIADSNLGNLIRISWWLNKKHKQGNEDVYVFPSKETLKASF